jgi:hypothetical protein
MFPSTRERVVTAARSILDAGGLCVLELCADVPAQRWEPRLLLLDRQPERVADAVVGEVARPGTPDARLVGYDRCTLRTDPALGVHLCHLAQLG